MSDEENLQEPLIEKPTASPEPELASPPVSKKRKRNLNLNSSLKETSIGETSAGKKRRRPKSKSKATEEDELDLEAGTNNAFSHMDNHLLADYVAQRTRRYESDLSSIELEDRYIPGKYCTVHPKIRGRLSNITLAKVIEDTTAWEQPRTLDNLPSFLEKFAGNSTKLWSASKKNGSPHTIIVTAAGLRAAEIAR